MNSAKTIGELIKILLRDEYLDFLLTYKKVPLWCVDANGRNRRIVNTEDPDTAIELILSVNGDTKFDELNLLWKVK